MGAAAKGRLLLQLCLNCLAPSAWTAAAWNARGWSLICRGHSRLPPDRPAGMFEPAPPDRFAVATMAGLVVNNLSTLLYMVGGMGCMF